MMNSRRNGKTIRKTAKTHASPVRRMSRSAPAYVVIDHPIENEGIQGTHYAIRIGSSDKGCVEVCIDGYEWSPCRRSEGFWWFDWGNYSPGRHTIQARLRSDKGRVLRKSLPRKCSCEF